MGLCRRGQRGNSGVASAERRMTFPPREVSDTFVCVERERASNVVGGAVRAAGQGGSRKGGTWQDRTLDEANLGHKSCSGAGGAGGRGGKA